MDAKYFVKRSVNGADLYWSVAKHWVANSADARKYARNSAQRIARTERAKGYTNVVVVEA